MRTRARYVTSWNKFKYTLIVFLSSFLILRVSAAPIAMAIGCITIHVHAKTIVPVDSSERLF